MRVATLGALGDSYTVYERGFSPLQERAGYMPSFLPTFNQNMRHRGGMGAVSPGNGPLHPASLWDTMVQGDIYNTDAWNLSQAAVGVQAQAALWGMPVMLILGGLAGYFAGKRWG